VKTNIYKKLAGQTMLYGLGTMVPRLLNYSIMTFYYTRLFKVEEYGVITELYAYVVFLLVILTYGMETGFFRFATKSERPEIVYSTVIISLFCTSLLFILLVFSFDEGIARIIEYESNVEYIRWIAMIVAIDAFSSIPFAKLRIEEKSRKFAILKILNVVFTVFFIFLFFEFFPLIENKIRLPRFIYNPEIRIGYVLIANLLASGLILVLLLKDIVNIKIRFNKDLYLNILKYSLPLLIAGLAGTVNESLDRILLKIFTPEGQNAHYEIGIYGANYKIGVLLMMFVTMFRYAAEPFYFNYYRTEDAGRIFANIMKYFVIVGLVIIVGVLLFIDIIKYFIDPGYHEGLVIVPLILYAYLLYGIFFNLSIWYKLTNKTKFGAVFTLTGAAITVLINGLFIPIFSYKASAVAHIICYFTMTVMSYYVGRRYYRIDYQTGRIGEYILISIFIVIAGNVLDIQSDILNYILRSVLLISFVYYLMKREKLKIRTIIYRINESKNS